MSGQKYEHIWAKIGNSLIWEERIIKLLGINIDSKLTFHQHVSIICDKAGRKLKTQETHKFNENTKPPTKENSNEIIHRRTIQLLYHR